MTRPDTLASTHGYSLIELTTALLISSLLAAIAWASIIPLARSIAAWEKAGRVNGITASVSRRISADIRHIHAVELWADSSWILHAAGRPAVHYTLNEGGLLRNGHPVFPGSLRLAAVNLALNHHDLAFPSTPEVSRIHWLGEGDLLRLRLIAWSSTDIPQLDAAYTRRPGGPWAPDTHATIL